MMKKIITKTIITFAVLMLVFVLLFSSAASGQNLNTKSDKPKKIHPLLEETIKKSRSENHRVLITYKDEPTAANENKIKARGGKINKRFKAKPIKKLIAAELRGVEIEKLLAEDSNIELIEPDYKAELVLQQSVPLINATAVWQQYGVTGRNVKVAVIDTGVAEHPALAGRIKKHLTFVTEPIGDFNGHGTHVAGIIASNDARYKGVAPSADIYDVKVLSGSGTGWFSDILEGMQWAIDNGMNIMSMSLGAYIYCDGTDPVSKMVDYGVTRGVVSVVAAGNRGPSTSTIAAPGCAREAITVGATDKADSIASFSSRGPTADGRIKPDVVAPGVGITSTWNNGAFNTISGTSMAAPHITGVVALLMEDQGATITKSKILEVFQKTSKNLGQDRNIQGYGRVMAYKALEYIHPIDKTPPTIFELMISPNPASVGDVNIYFNVSEKLSSVPEVRLNSNLANYSSVIGLGYLYKYGVTPMEQQGNAIVAITAIDAAGNVGKITSNNLVIDTLPPINATVLINKGNATTYNTTIYLALSATDATTGVDTISISNDGITYSAPETYSTTKIWTLTEGYGKKTVYVKFVDKVKNSVTASDDIEYTKLQQCNKDRDCARGYKCQDGRCVNGEEKKIDDKCADRKARLKEIYDMELKKLNGWYNKQSERIERQCEKDKKGWEEKCEKRKTSFKDIYNRELNRLNEWYAKETERINNQCGKMELKIPEHRIVIELPQPQQEEYPKEQQPKQAPKEKPREEQKSAAPAPKEQMPITPTPAPRSAKEEPKQSIQTIPKAAPQEERKPKEQMEQPQKVPEKQREAKAEDKPRAKEEKTESPPKEKSKEEPKGKAKATGHMVIGMDSVVNTITPKNPRCIYNYKRYDVGEAICTTESFNHYSKVCMKNGWRISGCRYSCDEKTGRCN